MGDPADERRCGTCRWARWPTKDGRPRRNGKHGGRCTYPVPEPPSLPYALTASFAYRPLADVARNAVWPDLGTSCPCWEAKS